MDTGAAPTSFTDSFKQNINRALKADAENMSINMELALKQTQNCNYVIARPCAEANTVISLVNKVTALSSPEISP